MRAALGCGREGSYPHVLGLFLTTVLLFASQLVTGEPFVGEIRMFAFNFAPKGWAFCNGQLLPINTNTALYSLLGMNYGGLGETIFALPDLQGKFPIHAGVGNGPGLTGRNLGASGGVSGVTLTQAEIPAHTHALQCSSTALALSTTCANSVLGQTTLIKPYADAWPPYSVMDPNSIATAGSSEPHDNMPPYLVSLCCLVCCGFNFESCFKEAVRLELLC